MIRGRIALMTLLTTGFFAVPGAVRADGWSEFETRCVSALESLSPPLVNGLTRALEADGFEAYALPEGRHLRIETAPEDGRLACAVRDPSGAASVGFRDWIAQAVAAGRYVEVAVGLWHSDAWIEPVLAVEERIEDGGVILRIVETRLET